ncbi:MAG: methyl-accepting chemotaxis protein [Exilispira sp.]
MVCTLLDGYYKQYNGDVEKITLAIRDSVLKMRYENGTNYVWIHRLYDSFFILHPSASLDQKFKDDLQDVNGKYIIREFNKVVKESENNDGFVDYFWNKLGEEQPQPKLSYIKLYKNLNWVIGSGIYIDDVLKLVNIEKENLKKDYDKILLKMLIISISAVLFLTIIIILFAKYLFNPLNSILGKISEIAEGGADLTKRLPIKSKDEIGILTIEFNKFLDYIEKLIKTIKSQSIKLKKQIDDLSSNIQQTAASMKEMDSSFESVKNTLKIYSENLEKNNQTQKQLVDQIKDTKIGYDEEEKELTRLSSAIEELNANALSVSNNSNQTEKITKDLLEISTKGKTSLEEVFNHIEQIKQNAEKIKNTTKLIEDIADKTNLLAMNASIEAAHAGESGKGFAVVADEIRKLAENSGKNSKEINTSLDLVVSLINETSNKSKYASEIFNNIFESINQTERMINEVAQSMVEESNAINDMLNSMKKIMSIEKNVVANNFRLTEQSEILFNVNKNLTQISEEIKTANEKQSIEIKNMMFSMENMDKLSRQLVNVSDELEDLIGQFKILEESDQTISNQQIESNKIDKEMTEEKLTKEITTRKDLNKNIK